MYVKKILYISLFFGTLLFTSCKQEGNNIYKQKNYNSVNAALTDLQTVYNAFAFAHYNAINTKDNCWEVTRDTNSAKKTITLHFRQQPGACQFFDSLSTTGSIILQYEGEYKSSKTPSLITFSNYKTGGVLYEGIIRSTHIDAMNYELKFTDVIATSGNDKRIVSGNFMLNLGNDVLLLGDFKSRDSAAYELTSPDKLFLHQL